MFSFDLPVQIENPIDDLNSEQIRAEDGIGNGGDFELFDPDRYFKGCINNYEMNDEEWKKEYGTYSFIPYDHSLEIFFNLQGEDILIRKVDELESGHFPPEAGDLFVRSDPLD